MKYNIAKNLSFVDGFTEVVEEENYEDDGGVTNLRRRQSRFKLIKDENEFNKKTKRNRSTELRDDKHKQYFTNLCGDVSENEEEEISDSSLEK